MFVLQDSRSYGPRESRGIPIRRRRRDGLPALRRFFYTRPNRSFPFFDRRIITLHGPTFGFLVAPTDLVEEFAHMIAMVLYSQSTLDQIGDSQSGPQLCSVTVDHRSLGQKTNKLSSLFQGQSRGPSWRWLGFQCLLATGLEGVAPPHNTARMAPYASGNLMKRKFLLQQCNYTMPTLLQRFWRPYGSHRDTPNQGCLYYVALFMRKSIV